MPKVLAAMSFLLIIRVAFAARISAGGPLYGDASCDGNVNSIDSTLILQTDAGLIDEPACPENADANGNGTINSIDSTLILQYGAGLINRLGPGSTLATPTRTRTPTRTPPRTPTPVIVTPGPSCHPSYSGVCLDPSASDYDCAGGSGNGPLYIEGPFQVVGPDKFDLDGDGDGVGCE